MTALPEPAFVPGQSVLVHDDIPAKIDRVIYCRNMVRPIYSVEWWQDGKPGRYEVEEDDLTAAP